MWGKVWLREEGWGIDVGRVWLKEERVGHRCGGGCG